MSAARPRATFPPMTTTLDRPMTRDEFFAWAERQGGRHEFDGRKAVAVIGGTNNHGLISRNLNGPLFLRLRGGPFTSMNSGGVAVPTGGIGITVDELYEGVAFTGDGTPA